MQKLPKVYSIKPKYARVCESLSKNKKLWKGMQKYNKVCQSMPNYAKVCKSNYLINVP